MSIIRIPIVTAASIISEAECVEDWCEQNIGPYGSTWRWIAIYDNYHLLHIENDNDAIIFKLANPVS